MYYNLDKNKDSIFFQSKMISNDDATMTLAVYDAVFKQFTMMLFCILHFCILGQTVKMATSFGKDNVWEK